MGGDTCGLGVPVGGGATAPDAAGVGAGEDSGPVTAGHGAGSVLSDFQVVKPGPKLSGDVADASNSVISPSGRSITFSISAPFQTAPPRSAFSVNDRPPRWTKYALVESTPRTSTLVNGASPAAALKKAPA
ncbi:hypothetical protein AB0C02_30955 [Micromonospora sp. NPDC048999]|uniref:hypothetical protein n=1 Tax=Micromonospora sp. NPDC048999 TaxID=3155391 RepID=UPI003409D3CC